MTHEPPDSEFDVFEFAIVILILLCVIGSIACLFESAWVAALLFAALACESVILYRCRRPGPG